MSSPLHADGSAWSGAPDRNGVAIDRARREHEVRYAELVGGERARLVVLGCEVGGRWAPEATDVLRSLAAVKAREAPELLRRSATQAWHRRWSCILSVAAQTAVAETMMAPGSSHLAEVELGEPALGDLLSGWSGRDPPVPSRLPLL